MTCGQHRGHGRFAAEDDKDEERPDEGDDLDDDDWDDDEWDDDEWDDDETEDGSRSLTLLGLSRTRALPPADRHPPRRP